MKYLLILTFVFIAFQLNAQNLKPSVEVINQPRLVEGKIHLEYKLQSSNEHETYNISVFFFNDKNKVIKPFSLAGDLNNVFGNEIKKITWDYSKDVDYLPKLTKTVIKIEKVNTLSANVFIRSEPSNAKVYFDNGNYAGITPFSAILEYGHHNVSIILDGHEVNFSTINIVNSSNEYLFKLIYKPPNLRISSKPENSTVFIDTKNMGSIIKEFSLKPGKHTIKASASGFLSRKKTITSNNKMKSRKFYLKPNSQWGLGYIFGEGSRGVEVLFRFSRIEMILGFMELDALSNIGYNNYSSLGFSGVLGYRIPYPIDFSVHAGYGLRSFVNKDNLDDFKRFNSVVIGVTLPIYISPKFCLFLKSDYWSKTENSGIFLYSCGLLFKY